MRSIGQNPTEDEINELVMESDMNGDGTLQLNEFIEMMKKKSSESDQTEVSLIIHLSSRNLKPWKLVDWTLWLIGDVLVLLFKAKFTLEINFWKWTYGPSFNDRPEDPSVQMNSSSPWESQFQNIQAHSTWGPYLKEGF